MFFQSDMTKTEIAEKLGVSRRTIYQWSVDGNWEKLRQSARNMPVMLAEKVYYLIGHLTDQMLQKDALSPIVTKEEVNMLAKLTNIVGKLRKGSTVSENMETFNYFLERINSKDPELAEMVTPHIAEYIEDRRGKTERDFLLSGFTEHATLPYPEDELMEKWLDEEEEEKLRQEQQASQPQTQSRQPQPIISTTQNKTNTQPQPNPGNSNNKPTQSTSMQSHHHLRPKPSKSIFSHYRTTEKKSEKTLVAA